MSSMEAPRRLSKEEAQQEAGMLQAHLELSDIKDAKAEDYDAALEAIEELRAQAESNPESAVNVAGVAARLGERSKFALEAFSAAILTDQGGAQRQMSKVFGDHEKAMYQLSTAAEKLRKLKEKANAE